MRSEGTAHKKSEAPWSFDSAARNCHLERSREIFPAERLVCNCAISITACS